MALILCFVLLPLWSMHKAHYAGATAVRWRDVGWLFAYFIIGFTVMLKLRPLLGIGVH